MSDSMTGQMADQMNAGMTSGQHGQPDVHGHDPHGHDPHGHDEMHATLGGYMIGFGLSVLLTAIPFWLVMSGILGSNQVTGIVITVFAAVQVVVHMIYFLHMNAKAEQGWTLLSLVFTLLMVAITLSGSLWVMYHLNNNMMPHSFPEPM